MKDADFTSANQKVAMQLRLSGAKYIDRIIDNSPNIGSIPINAKYVGIVNPLCEFDLRANPDFIPVEKYPNPSIAMENEIGTIGEVRYIFNEDMYIEDDGSDKYGWALIMGKDHTAQIPLKGKNRIETIVKGLNSDDKSDPLNRLQTIGLKSWLGAYTLSPEKVALIKAKIEY
jgi:N4-gp56 family major capsid protein